MLTALTLLALFQQQDDELQRAIELLKTDPARAVPQLEAIAEKKPKTDDAATALLTLAQHWNGRKELTKSVDVLRKFQTQFGPSRVTYEAVGLIEAAIGKRFCHPAGRFVPTAFGATVQPQGATLVQYRLLLIDRDYVLGELRKGESGILDAPADRISVVHTWTLRFDPAQVQSQYLSCEVKGPGWYVVEEEIDGFAVRTWSPARFHGMMTKGGRNELFVYTYRRDTGEPVAAEFEFYEDGKVVKGSTDRTGRATLARAGKEGWILGFVGQEILDCYVGEWSADSPDACYVRTDRPLYRGGQTVHFRAILRDRSARGLEYKKIKTVPVEIRDPEDRRVWRQELPLGELGTLDGSFTLADEPALGTYRIVVCDGHQGEYWWDSDHIGRFDVKAYRKPEIKIEVTPGEFGKATIRAKYLFGSPAAGAQVQWVVKSRWVYEDRTGGIDMPDSYRWYTERRSESWYWNEDTIASGEGVTDAKGKLAIEFPSEVEEWMSYVLETEVVDASRRPAYAIKTLPTPQSDVRLRIQFGRNFCRAGQRATVSVLATDLDGKPVRDRKIDLSAYEDAGDGEFEEFFRGNGVTDKLGVARFEVLVERSGQIRFRARTGKAVVRRELWSAGEDPLRGEDEVTLEAIPEQFVYRSGEKVAIFVKAGTKGMSGIMTIETDRVLRSEVIKLSKKGQVLEVEIPEITTPTVTIKFHAWKDDAATAAGVRVLILPRDKWLDVTVKTDRETYRPREKAKVTIEVKDGFGRPVQGEVTLGIVDEAIYLLKADTTDDIRKALYPPSSDYVETSACGPFDDDFLDPFSRDSVPLTGATFSLDEEGAAPPLEGVVPTETRRWFPDTLHWGTVKTDANGLAVLDVEVADSLTTWVFTAHAVGTAHQVGWGRSTTLVRKNVIARIVAPRFLTQGDEATIAVIVHNELGSSEFDVSLEAKGAEIVGKSSWSGKIDSVSRIEFLVRAKNYGTVTFSAKAMGKRESDAMELDIPVKVHGVQMAEHRSGKIEEVAVEKLALPKDALDPELIVVVSPGAASAVLDALPYLAGFPYGCVEQTMSRFLPSLMAHRALKKLGVKLPQLEAELPKMLNAGLQRLYGFQHSDGGWGWWTHDATNAWMTAYVVMGLSEAKAAGVEVDEKVLERGVECLKNLPAEPYGLWALAHEADLPATLPEPKDARGRLHLALALLKKNRADEARKLLTDLDHLNVEDTSLHLRAALQLKLKTDALVQKILANRRGSAWLSTRESAFAIYALTDYIVETGELASEQTAVVKVNGREVWRGTVTKETIADFRGLVRVKDLKAENEVRVEGSKRGLYYSATLTWFEGGEPLRPSRGAIVVARKYERVIARKDEDPLLEPLEPGSEVKPGDIVQVTVTLRSDKGASCVLLEDPFPAGCEPIEEDNDGWDWWWCQQEFRDDRACMAANEVGSSPETFTYRLRVMLPGKYHVLPARAWDMYDPSKTGTSGEFELRIRE